MSASNGARGVGALELLTLLFVGLKLGGVIDWSWWWVTSPIWIVVGLLLIVGVAAAIVQTLKETK